MSKIIIFLFFVLLVASNLCTQAQEPILEYSYTKQNANPIGGAPLINAHTLFVLPGQITYTVRVVSDSIRLVKIPYNKLPAGFDTTYFDQLKKDSRVYQLKTKDIERKVFTNVDLITKIERSHQYEYNDDTYYDVIDTLTGFNWVLIDSFKIIANYKCQLAKGSLHDKIYLAWFTPQIPIPSGPAKLCGLPGFILEASTTDGTEKYSLDALFIPAKHPFEIKNYTFSKKEMSYKENYANFEKQLKIIQIQTKLDKN